MRKSTSAQVSEKAPKRGAKLKKDVLGPVRCPVVPKVLEKISWSNVS